MRTNNMAALQMFYMAFSLIAVNLGKSSHVLQGDRWIINVPTYCVYFCLACMHVNHISLFLE
jgi:hypothetical protein